MDEKKVNGNEFQPENAGTNPEPNNNTENINAKPEEQSTQNTTSGWVFSDKNVSGAQQNAEQSTQNSAGQNAGPSAENREGSAFFHHNAQPDESGWYRSGPNPSAEQKSAYNSRYSYGQQAGEQGSYENQQADPKSSESYKWNYEDYNQQAPKQPTNKNKKNKNKGLKVFAIIMCAILCAGVVGMAGYGTYALVSGQRAQQEMESESAEAEAAPSAQLTLNDKPESTQTDEAVNLSGGELTITQRAEKVMPSAVGIVAYIQSSQSIFGGEQSQGSGIILSEDGYIVTNQHVIDGATSVKVVLNDGSEYNASVVGEDEKTDLAVLKIEATGLTPAEFGNSDQMQIGEQVIAVGNPGGLELAGSVTVGYVSAVNRPITTSNGGTIDCIQTDAAINPGNSGGALVNTYGQVIGINSQKIAATEYEGIGFAISINEAQPIINDLIQYGYVRGRVVMGITMQMIDQISAQMYGYQPGVGVVSVEENSPASKAGLVPGDIITEIDGEALTSTEVLTGILEEHKPGDVITLTVYRQSAQGGYAKGQELTMKLELGEAGAPKDDTTTSSSTQQSQQQQEQGSIQKAFGLN